MVSDPTDKLMAVRYAVISNEHLLDKRNLGELSISILFGCPSNIHDYAYMHNVHPKVSNTLILLIINVLEV